MTILTNGKSHDETEAPTAALSPPSLSETLRERTRVIHTQAERSGIINDILRGQASRADYALLLRNLVPAYERMEDGLDRHRATPAVGAVARRELYRSAALAADLAALHGEDWQRSIPLLPAGQKYADCIATAAAGDGAQLIGHAYARYLGDLSGGQILKKLLGRSLGLEPQHLSFYDFPNIEDANVFKSDWRNTLNQHVTDAATIETIAAEAVRAFEHNIAVSEAVQAFAREANGR